MRILVLGGCGMQGRTVVYDLVKSRDVTEVVCADSNLKSFESIKPFVDTAKIRLTELDANDDSAMSSLMGKSDVVIDLLPRAFTVKVCRCAIETETSVVNTNYGEPVHCFTDSAVKAKIAIMPECGLDPGIDLILYGRAKQMFDELHVINSYCGGFPEKRACDNPLNYKISWIWEGVLSSTKRDARMIKNEMIIDIPAKEQHLEQNIHQIDYPGLGTLEAIPNGDAVLFTDLLGVSQLIRETGRYSLRWPGWSAFWHPLKDFGFLNEEPVSGLDGSISPYEFLNTFLEPQLQYRPDEKDLVVMLNIFEGLKNGEEIRMTSRFIIERDLETGIMAMSKGVGYPASIVAQMIGSSEISSTGVLSPISDIPYENFVRKLSERDITIEENIEEIPIGNNNKLFQS